MKNLFYHSVLEKYSFSILQFLATLFMTKYFGVKSIGMIGSFTFFVALSTVISEAGSSFIILGCDDGKFKQKLMDSVFIALFLGSLQFLMLFSFSDFYTRMLSSSEDLSQVMRLYGVIMISSPLQMVFYSALVRLGAIKTMTRINLISWSVGFIVLLLVYYRGNDYRMVVWYFISMSISRATLSYWFVKGYMVKNILYSD